MIDTMLLSIVWRSRRLNTWGVDVAHTLNRWLLVIAVFGLLASPALLPGAGDELSAQDKVHVSEVCMDCHEEHQLSLVYTPHQILLEDMDKQAIACTDCHPGPEGHWDDDPEEYGMTNPAKLDAWGQAQLCGQCHTNSHQQNMMERNVHLNNDVGCIDCHALHIPDGAAAPYGGGQNLETHYTGLLKTNETDLCLSCHINVRGQFAKPTHHPVDEGAVRCSDCHMSIENRQTLLTFEGTNASCFNCHNEFQMPFPFPHQATVDWSVQEGACLSCHEAHGANLPRLLKQPYEGPHFQLCSQCHSVPRHNNNTQHGSTFAGVPCNDCHVDIHGSYTSRYFFTPQIQADGCINSGCHRF